MNGNCRPDLAIACKTLGGVEDTGGGFVFKKAADAQRAAALLGQVIDVADEHPNRQTTLKAHKDGRLIVQIDREKSDQSLPGWLEKKGAWTKIFDVKTEQNEVEDKAGSNMLDSLIRHVETPDGDNDGWLIKKNGVWGREPYAHARIVLQNNGIPKTEAEAILGGSVLASWKLVNLPFREEYPGDRQWNRGAAQFKCKPAELSDDEAPCHPHWDLIVNHFFDSLTPILKELPWAIEAGIRTGGDYGRAWIACMFRDPFEPTPYIFAYGPENSGKSILHEGLNELVTKGIVSADRPLTTKGDFNGELANAILCVVEEKQVSKHPNAMNKIKEWVTCRRLSVRKMRTDAYEQDSTLHWLQCSNYFHSCPVFPGDTRITVVEVPNFKGEEIPKREMLEKLAIEAPHFLRTLMDLELPSPHGRLRIPPVETPDKAELADEMAPVSRFLVDCCELEKGHRIIKCRLHAAYENWALENGFEQLPIGRFGEQLLAVSKNHIRAKGQMKEKKDGKMKHCYQGVCLKDSVA